MIRASATPSNGAPEWNAFRDTIIQHLVDIEHWMTSHQKGMNTEGIAYELAERMQVLIVDERDFNRVLLWVAGLRAVAQETIRLSITNNGQHQLFTSAA